MKEEEETCENCYYNIYKDDCPVPFEMQGQLSSTGTFYCPFWTHRNSLSHTLKCMETITNQKRKLGELENKE
ncbi:MAG: hypothetical protein U9N61_00155 [Euryarchaeota archaeon]|nr:hypothetical protein [Euryarchaeota archaeon]